MMVGLFFLAMCVGHVFEQRTVEQFKNNWGSNLFEGAGARRRDAASTWLFGYLLFLAAGYPGEAILRDPMPLWFIGMLIWGGRIAWMVGEAVALKRLTRDLVEAHARTQVEQGLFDAPPVITTLPQAEQPVANFYPTPAPQYDFSFDPDRFKR